MSKLRLLTNPLKHIWDGCVLINHLHCPGGCHLQNTGITQITILPSTSLLLKWSIGSLLPFISLICLGKHPMLLWTGLSVQETLLFSSWNSTYWGLKIAWHNKQTSIVVTWSLLLVIWCILSSNPIGNLQWGTIPSTSGNLSSMSLTKFWTELGRLLTNWNFHKMLKSTMCSTFHSSNYALIFKLSQWVHFQPLLMGLCLLRNQKPF